MESINNIIGPAPERIYQLKNRLFRNTIKQSKEKKEWKEMKKAHRIYRTVSKGKFFWVIEVQGEKEKMGWRILSEDIIAESFPNLGGYMNIQLEEGQGL